jgi:hypothetical protein
MGLTTQEHIVEIAAIGTLGKHKEKFAQLIVKECMNLVTYVGHSTRGFDCCGHVRFTNEKIKEHFGVES